MRALRARFQPNAVAEGPNRVERPWRRGLVLVCLECEGSTSMKPTAVLQLSKAAARSKGRKEIRVTGSGCLDVCPTKATAIAIVVDGADARCIAVKDFAASSFLGMLL
jgi:hypothetical protein